MLGGVMIRDINRGGGVHLRGGSGVRGVNGARIASVAIVSSAVMALLVLGCVSSGSARKACLSFSAVETLNLYDGQPHRLTVYIYPLSSTEGFMQTGADDLLAGARPPGIVAPPVPITVEPGESKRHFQALFPLETRYLGVIADYYRVPADPDGNRREVVPARCGILKPKLLLLNNDILTD